MSDDLFAPGADWDAEAHVRLLRTQGGASSGYTADLIEKLHRALSDERAHADAMAEWAAEYRQAIIAVDGGGDFAGKLDRVNQAAECLDDLIDAHRARRQG